MEIITHPKVFVVVAKNSDKFIVVDATRKHTFDSISRLFNDAAIQRINNPEYRMMFVERKAPTKIKRVTKKTEKTIVKKELEPLESENDESKIRV